MQEEVTWALQVMGLSKAFDALRAVDNIDLAVPTGVFFGLLGPNGAGKSTSLSMITGLLRPDAGTIRVLGLDVWPDPVPAKARIGVVPETLLLFERLSGRELLDYVGRLRGLDSGVVKQRTDELLDVFGLTDSAGKWVIDYSQGMRKKISLAAAMIHAPTMLFLDEPFESVDPVSVRLIRAVLSDYVASGGTVVLSSHVMATVESLCDEVAIMHAGRVVASGSVASVSAGQGLEEAFARAVGAEELDASTLSWLRAAPEAHNGA